MSLVKFNNLIELFDYAKKDRLNNPFLFEVGKNKSLNSISWKQVDRQINNLSKYLVDQNISKGDRILLVSENRPEWLISDLSIISIGAITVPNYTTYTQKDFEFILKDCGPKGLIVSNQKLFDKIYTACKKINYEFNFIVSFEKLNQDSKTVLLSEIKHYEKNIISQIQRTDPACIIYTSGTQGTPKGVVLSHGGILANVEGAYEIIKEINTSHYRFLTWLPLSHSYEHTVQFVQISLGAEIIYCANLEKLLETIKIAKPVIMTAVPRFYNNLYAKMKAKLKESGIFRKTVELGTKKFLNQKLSFFENFLNHILDIIVRRKVLKNFGGNLKAFISGGGPLDKDIGIFLNSVGLKTLQGYGLTEFSPIVSCNPVNKIKIETVGIPFNNVELRIDEDGEILVKGESMMIRYWNNQEATSEIIKNGWLYTGDIGKIDEDGYLKITDRKKDIIVSEGGDNISPSKIENLLCLYEEIKQAFVFGDNKKYLSCLIVVNKDLGSNNNQIQSIIDVVNKDLTTLEKIRKFKIISEEFTIENEMMTPTLKLKRYKIREAYKNILENFYTK